MKRERLELALVSRGLVSDLDAAKQAIDDRLVQVNGSIAISYSHLVAPNDQIRVVEQSRFVSRGGFKLEAALAYFKIDLAGLRVLDVGASTGGFTDCALQHGARQVVALDVGKNLLHEKLCSDERVVEVSETNAREIVNLISAGTSTSTRAGAGAGSAMFAEKFDVVVGDLSFISVHEVLPSMLAALKTDGLLILLVKPQFEATRLEADKASGVIEDPEIHQRVCREIGEASSQKGCSLLGVIESPIRGQQGNIEFLLAAKYTNPVART
ncbi:MAG: TlyA family RNA methyltransferase [Actinobacteria bacterium]|nr:TlyA family RNA methyltransferase [Actinomycetota bacterium]